VHREIEILQRLYQLFNARDIDGVLWYMADDVVWANGMEGGHVLGHAAVRDYWTRQWAIVSPTVEPVGFEYAGDDIFMVDVRQTVCTVDGQPIDGMKNMKVLHVFTFRGGKVSRFDIG
jgi:ketosteroid isomerase-like protein